MTIDKLAIAGLAEIAAYTLRGEPKLAHDALLKALQAERDRALSPMKRMVDAQAEDEGLWFWARTASEGYLQIELRNLHAIIERALKGDSNEEEPG